MQVRAVSVEDKNSAVETVSRERATNDPGSVGAPMSGVVVEVRVKEGAEIKKGDPICGESRGLSDAYSVLTASFTTTSDERDEGVSHSKPLRDRSSLDLHLFLHRWSPLLLLPCLGTSSASSCMRVSTSVT